MDAKQFLESKGIFSLDTKKRYNEVINWMEEYHQALQLLQPDVICSLYQGVLNDTNARCKECGKAEWQHK